MIKFFVLDTNVLLHNANSIEAFGDNNIVIPMAVVEELDKFKKNQDLLGRNARQVIRNLDRLREKGHLTDGVPLAEIGSSATGKLFVRYAEKIDDPRLLQLFETADGRNVADNRILAVALDLHESGKPVVFVSKDINLRLKADALNLRVEDFNREKVQMDVLYTGFQNFEVENSVISKLHKEKEIEFKAELCPNEFAVLNGKDKSALVRNAGNRKIRLVESPPEWRVWNITSRNKEQRMALDLLLDPAIKLVTLIGGAGTGKTLLALAAALENTLHDNIYERILVSRPIVPLGNDIGFMPGDKNDKLRHWMQPIFDNLDFLMGESSNGKNKPPKSGINQRVQNLLNNDQLSLEAITYIRGRSIARQYIIIDEAQNLTPHEVKTIISRAGEDTKIVLTGDPAQIDNPYLDAASNGLTYLVDRLKNQPIYGHVTLKKSERSELAGIAARML